MQIEYSVAIDSTGPAGQASGRGEPAVAADSRRTGVVAWVSFAFDEAVRETPEVAVAFQGGLGGSSLFWLTKGKGGGTGCSRKQAMDAAGSALVGAAVRLPPESLGIVVTSCDARWIV